MEENLQFINISLGLCLASLFNTQRVRHMRGSCVTEASWNIGVYWTGGGGGKVRQPWDGRHPRNRSCCLVASACPLFCGPLGRLPHPSASSLLFGQFLSVQTETEGWSHHCFPLCASVGIPAVKGFGHPPPASCCQRVVASRLVSILSLCPFMERPHLQCSRSACHAWAAHGKEPGFA